MKHRVPPRLAPIALAAALLCSASLTTAAAGARHGEDPLPEFGTQFHATWTDYTDATRERVLDRLEAAGVTWVRIDVGWQTLEPRRSGRFARWYLESLDHAVRQAHRRDLSVVLTVFATPEWARAGGDERRPPRDPDDYGAIMGRLAERFRDRVDAYEIWNEPNSEHFFDGTPEDYAELLAAAHRAIKRSDRTATVVAGATEYNDDGFLAAVYDAGGGDSFDVWSTHPYLGDADAPPETPDDGTIWTMDHVREVRAVMTANGDHDLPLWFTEFGWSTHRTASDAQPWRRGVSEARQAKYLVRALHFVADEHPYVTVMIWYNERDKATGDRHEDGYGLMTRELRPKPAYLAVEDLLGAR